MQAKALKLAVRLPPERLSILLEGFFHGQLMAPHCLTTRQRSSSAQGRKYRFSLHFIHQFAVNLTHWRRRFTPVLLYERLEGLMSALSKICRRLCGLWVLAFLVAGPWTPSPARAADEVIGISVDQAQLVTLPDRVSTIIIGNPLIADATLQGGGILVVTGKGYGATNLLALDRTGRVLMSRTVEVRGAGTSDIVTVFKGVERESYSCAPNCERRITLGDSPAFFNATLSQSGARNGQAQGAAK